MANISSGPQKTKTAANAIITAAAAIATLVFINVVGSRNFGRADITEDSIYKLSKVSLDTVKNLPDRMNVKAIMTGDLQPPLNTTAQYVRDMLDEYKAASGGKMTVEVIDPAEIKKERQRIEADQKKATDDATKAKLEEQLSEVKQREDEIGKYKVQKISLERVSESKLEIGSDNYLGIGFAYGDQIESIPSLTGTEGLEFQITGTIRKLVNTKKHKVAFANSEGELSKAQGMQMIGQFLADYDTSEIALDKPIPDDIEALVIAGPKQAFNEKAKFHIDQFLMKGKSVAFFVDGMVIEAPQGMQQMPGMDTPKIGRQNDTNLIELFEKYGVKLRDDLVLDKQNVIGLVPVNGRMQPTNYPTFVAVTEDGFTKGSMITSKVKALVTPFTSSVELVGDLKDGKVEGVKATPIARTSKASWRNSGFFLFNPTQPLTPPASEADKGPFVLGYSIEGKLKSAYPNGLSGGDSAESTPENAGVLKEAAGGARLVIMGCSGILSDEYLRLAQYVPAYGQNLLFAINTIDWLIKDDSLVALRAKGATQRPFTPVPDSSMNSWRYAIEFGLSFFLIGLGLVLWLLRTQRRSSANA